MSRIRTIKPDFWQHPKVIRCSRDARLTFLGLLNEVDDEGRCRYLPVRLVGLIFPADEDVVPTLFADWIDELETAGLVETYDAGESGKILAVIGFSEHQRINKFTPSSLPSRESVPRGSSVTPSRVRKGSGKGKEEEPSFEEDFLLFWESVPRKQDKALARKAYIARRREGIEAEVLLTTIANYALSVEDTPAKYIKYPATFLAKDGPYTEWAIVEPTNNQYDEMSRRKSEWT